MTALLEYFTVQTVLLEYFDPFHANYNCSMFNKAIPRIMLNTISSLLYSTLSFASIAFMMIVMMMTIGTSGY